VHRDDREGVAGERDLEQWHAPDPTLALRPGTERGELARVVAEAAAGEHAVEHGQRSLQARGATADDLGGGERELDRRTQSVVRDGVEEQPVELHELAVPVARRPAHDGASIRTAEVSVVVRTDLVSLA